MIALTVRTEHTSYIVSAESFEDFVQHVEMNRQADRLQVCTVHANPNKQVALAARAIESVEHHQGQ